VPPLKVQAMAADELTTLRSSYGPLAFKALPPIPFRLSLTQLVDEHPYIFRVVDGHDDEMYASAGECLFQRGS
jgi:hypothetical protein